MKPRTETGSESMFARTVLDMAAEVESAEMRIKFDVLKAAEAGDMNKIIDIVTRWVTEPATEVLKTKKQNMP